VDNDVNAEPPIERFKVEHQLRRPGYARCHPASVYQAKAGFGLLLSGYIRDGARNKVV